MINNADPVFVNFPSLSSANGQMHGHIRALAKLRSTMNEMEIPPLVINEQAVNTIPKMAHTMSACR
jgi:hypothetical protein